MLNHYIRSELDYENDLPYEILTGRVHPWNYNNVQNRYLNVAETLREAMTRNPALRTFVASGYYDPYRTIDCRCHCKNGKLTLAATVYNRHIADGLET